MEKNDLSKMHSKIDTYRRARVLLDGVRQAMTDDRHGVSLRGQPPRGFNAETEKNFGESGFSGTLADEQPRLFSKALQSFRQVLTAIKRLGMEKPDDILQRALATLIAAETRSDREKKAAAHSERMKRLNADPEFERKRIAGIKKRFGKQADGTGPGHENMDTLTEEIPQAGMPADATPHPIDGATPTHE